MSKSTKLHWYEETGEPVRISKSEATVLNAFRRSAYAEPMRELLNKLLDNARLANEEQEASEANRMQVAATKGLINTLFDGKVELE